MNQNSEYKYILDGRPKRDGAIDSDEMIQIHKDLKELSQEDFYDKYFEDENDN